MSSSLIPSSSISCRSPDLPAVRRIEAIYNAVSGGTVVNEVERRYDAFNILIEDRQAHDGAVDGSTLKVQYTYSSGTGNQLRRTSLTYPNGRQLDSQYGSANSIDDHLNRINALKVNGETEPLVSYTYAGLAWQVVVGLPQPEIELNYKRQIGEPVSDAGDIYFGYDRFGRSIDLRWQKSGTPLVHLQYGFDANSCPSLRSRPAKSLRMENAAIAAKQCRTWRNDLVAPSSAQQDRHYRYDTLSQVVAEDRGDINVNRTAIAGIPASGSRWDYDETGNWKVYQQLANGTTTLDQPRTHDKGNRLLEIGAGAGPIRVDRAGRMLELPPVEGAWDETFEIVWDAWSRIVEVKQGESTVGKYAYDGLTRRITRETGSELIHTYYSDTWRPLEDRVTGSATPGTPTVQAHYLWGARHRDDLIRRDRATTTPGTLTQTRYVLMDYFSPAAITDASGTVTERYAFSAFGLRNICTPDYTPRTASESAFEFSFQGQFEDIETGWLNYGFRYYIPALGRWPSRDPIGEAGGMNLYGMAYNDILNSVEFLGLEPAAPDCCETERRRMRDARDALEAALANQTASRTAHQDALASEANAKQAVDEAKGTLRGLQQDFIFLGGLAVAAAATARATCFLASVTPPPHRFALMAGCWAARATAAFAAGAVAVKAAQIDAQHGVIQDKMATHNAAIAARRAAKGNLDAAGAQVNAAIFVLQLAATAAANCIPAPDCYCTPLL
jgi:RHS repeat-associated protein